MADKIDSVYTVMILEKSIIYHRVVIRDNRYSGNRKRSSAVTTKVAVPPIQSDGIKGSLKYLKTTSSHTYRFMGQIYN